MQIIYYIAVYVKYILQISFISFFWNISFDFYNVEKGIQAPKALNACKQRFLFNFLLDLRPVPGHYNSLSVRLQGHILDQFTSGIAVILLRKESFHKFIKSFYTQNNPSELWFAALLKTALLFEGESPGAVLS